MRRAESQYPTLGSSPVEESSAPSMDLVSIILVSFEWGIERGRTALRIKTNPSQLKTIMEIEKQMMMFDHFGQVVKLAYT